MIDLLVYLTEMFQLNHICKAEWVVYVLVIENIR